MSMQERRNKLYETLPEGSLLLSYAGVALHTNEDDYYSFEVNSQFFYLTGLERANMAFMAVKANGTVHDTLFIEEADPRQERWTGKMPTKEDAAKVSGIEDIRYIEDLSSAVSRYMGRFDIDVIIIDKAQ